jgi:protein TonB
MSRELQSSLAIALAIHAGLIAAVFSCVHGAKLPPARSDAITARFLVVEDKPPAPTIDPLPQLPEPPAPVPAVPELPTLPPQTTPPVQPETAPAPQNVVTTARHDAPAAPVAASRPNRAQTTTPKRAQAAGGGGAGASTLAHPRYAVNAPPNYPPEAKRLKQMGEVLLHVKVNAEGSAEAVSLKHSSGFPSLDEAALAAVRRWKFEPARVGGVAVAAEVDVPVRFQLK